MLEVLNKRRRSVDMNNMKYVNPFFQKALVKNQQKVFKWLAKFNKQEVIDVATKFNKKDSLDYNAYLAFVNNANPLLLSKYKQMTESLKVVGKLRGMLQDFAVANSIYTFILIIDEFYARNNTDESFNKREYWIELNNKYIDEIWNRYKQEYLNVFVDEPQLKEKAADAFEFDKETNQYLFFPKETTDILFGFLKKAWGHKKVSDRQFNTLYLYTLFVYYYMYSLNKLMTRILYSFPDPKQLETRQNHKFRLFGKKKKTEDNKKDSLD